MVGVKSLNKRVIVFSSQVKIFKYLIVCLETLQFAVDASTGADSGTSFIAYFPGV